MLSVPEFAVSACEGACAAFSRLALTSEYSRRPRDVQEVSRRGESTQRSLSNYSANGRPVRPPHLRGEKEGQVGGWGGGTSFSSLSQQNQAPVSFSGLLSPSFLLEPRFFQYWSSHSSGGNDSVDWEHDGEGASRIVRLSIYSCLSCP